MLLFPILFTRIKLKTKIRLLQMSFGNVRTGVNLLWGSGFYELHWLDDFADASILCLVGGYQVPSQTIWLQKIALTWKTEWRLRNQSENWKCQMMWNINQYLFLFIRPSLRRLSWLGKMVSWKNSWAAVFWRSPLPRRRSELCSREWILLRIFNLMSDEWLC